ncbi:hypothetical protein ABVT39_000273 [Epinephelus coioides]
MEGPADNPNKRKKTDSATDTQDLLSSEFSVLESNNKKLEVLGMLHQEIKDLKLPAMKLDPDLDGNPPFHPSAPPPYISATPNERRETDSTMPQQKTSSEATHPKVPVPPQNSTITPSSLIAHRLCHPSQNAAFNMHMVEVSGPGGTTLVFRPWTSADITAASQHLPKPTTSSKMFAEQFFTFCQEFKPTMNELKRILITKMKPTDWQKIAGKFPDADVRCKHITWEDESNTHYRDAVHHLCNAFTQAFPAKVNMEKITACRQKDGENPEYLTHLTEVFNTYSGFQLPDESSNTLDVWEIHLCNCFLSGLKLDIASTVKSSVEHTQRTIQLICVSVFESSHSTLQDALHK